MYTYQTGWNEKFRNNADVVSAVEKEELPVHSAMFYESAIMQGCSDDTSENKPRLESCLAKLKVHEVVVFLCQKYPLADPNRDVLQKHCCVIVEIAKKLECQSVLNQMGRYLEDHPDVILHSLRDYN